MRRSVTGISVGDHVVLHGLGNEELDGSTGRVLGQCTNQADRFIVFIESGRQRTREYRVKQSNLAPAKDRSKLFREKEDGQEEDDEEDEEEERRKNDEEDEKERVNPSRWMGDVKIVVILRGLHKKDEYMYNDRKARLLGKQGSPCIAIQSSIMIITRHTHTYTICHHFVIYDV